MHCHLQRQWRPEVKHRGTGGRHWRWSRSRVSSRSEPLNNSLLSVSLAEADKVVINTPGMLRLSVRPELEVFDTGHLVFAKELAHEGFLPFGKFC